MKQLFVILFIFCISDFKVRGIVFETLNKDERCFTKFIQEGSTISVNYQITGVQEQNEIARLVDIHGEDMFHKKGSKHSFNAPIPQKGNYKLCFKSVDNEYKSISFFFEEFSQNDNSRDTATDEQLMQVLQEMQSTHVKVNDVHQNQLFKQDREKVHLSMLNQLENVIKSWAYVKITISFALCLTQLYLLTSFIKNNHNNISYV